VIGAQPQLDRARWWWSPTVAPFLGLTPEQSMIIERVYNDGLPAQMRAGAEIASLGSLSRSNWPKRVQSSARFAAG